MAFLKDLSAIGKDVQYGLRLLRRTPVFTTVALITLALGIGGNTAIFSLVYGVLLRPLPYPQPERFVTLERVVSAGAIDPNTTSNKYLFWRERQGTLESIAAVMSGRMVSFVAADRAERVLQRSVTADFFRVLGVAPATGRFFSADDDRASAEPVAVLGYGCWRRQFGQDPNVMGRSIVLGRNQFTVIGVAPAGIDSTLIADVWTPLKATDPLGSGDNLSVLGRLKDDVKISQAQADLTVTAAAYRAEHPKTMLATESVGVFPYQREAVKGVRAALLILFGAVGLVLLIGCANLANLLLARVGSRRREIAVRTALGAGRYRILRQLLTESVCLSLAGSILGIGLAQFAVSAIVRFHPAGLPRIDEVAVDSRVLLFTLVLAVFTGIVFGIAPALQMLRADLQAGLREAGGRAGEARHAGLLRGALVVSEFSLSIVLLIGAALLLQSFIRLRQVDPGFDPSHLLTMEMSFTGHRYETAAQIAGFAQRSLDRLNGDPSVTAAMCSCLPLTNSFRLPLEALEGRPKPPNKYLDTVRWMAITPQFFQVMKIPVRTGRAFGSRDSASSPPVVIVNQAFASKHFPRGNPIGQRLTVGWSIIGPAYADAPREIVGVVADIREAKLQNTPMAALFVPLPQVVDLAAVTMSGMSPASLLVRTKGDPALRSREIAGIVQSIDPLLPVYNVRTMQQVLADSIQNQRFQMLLLGGFALVALVLAAIGIYGVMSYSVTQRAREIAIRIALGAERSNILRMVVGQAAVLTGIGVFLGWAGAFALTRVLESLLFGVQPHDVGSFLVAPLLLGGVGLLAGYLPARRATQMDPMVVLRAQ
jgi:putative ABC transport system permease protein